MTTDLVDLMHRARKVSVAARTATGNARAIVAEIDGDVIHLQRSASVFIALGMGDEYAVVESPELAVSYVENLLSFKRRARP
jgi:hypothetical protein